MRKLLNLAREERGSSLVEFAMTGWILMLLIVGVFQCMIAMYAYHFTTYAAQAGTRFAMVRGHTWSSQGITEGCGTSAPPSFQMKYNCEASSTDIQNYVQSLATPGILPSNVSINTTSSYVWPGKTPDGVTSTCSTVNSQGCLVKVTVNYTFNFVPYMPMTALSLTSTSETSILQ